MASDKEQKEENSGKLESVVYTDASGTQTVDIAALFLDERVEEDRKKLKEIFQNQQSRTSHGKSTYNV